MKNPVTDSVFYVGVNDHEIDLFEGQYPVPDGMSYNSYVIVDKAVAVMDTADGKKTGQWLANVEEILNGREPDYLVIQHMEPDHSASIEAFLKKYPNAVPVANAVAFVMMGNYFPDMQIPNKKVVKEGDLLVLGQHTLRFVFAPMVHWPEVMMTYELSEKLLFSADGFGKFGALDVEADWVCEARRYYFGIVGRFGMQVQNVLKKLEGLDIRAICPLHGPVLSENLDYYLNLYDIWSSYRAEDRGVCVCYASVYGRTKEAAELLCRELIKAGVEKIVCHDLTRCDQTDALKDAFRYDRLVLASVTYNADVFPVMKSFIHQLLEHDYQNRRIALIENGSWAPMANRVMKEMLQKSKNITFTEHQVTIKAAVNAAVKEQIIALAKELAEIK